MKEIMEGHDDKKRIQDNKNETTLTVSCDGIMG